MPELFKNDLNNLLNAQDNVASKVKDKLISVDVKKDKIINVIQDNENLWAQILKYVPLKLEDIKAVINNKGIIIENDELKKILRDLDVIFIQDQLINNI